MVQSIARWKCISSFTYEENSTKQRVLSNFFPPTVLVVGGLHIPPIWDLYLSLFFESKNMFKQLT